MKKLHDSLVSRYGWYERWHKNPKRSRHHFFALFLVLTLLGISALVLFSDLKTLIAASKQQSFLADKIARQLPPAGGIIGFAEDHILVQFKSGLDKRTKDDILSRHKLKEKIGIGKIDVEAVSINPGDKADEAAQNLNEKEGGNVVFAEVDAQLAPSFIPNDPDYPNEWHLPQINSPVAWDTTNGAGITIAITDTGVDATHQDLAADIVPGWNFVDNNSDTADVYGHGTEVAGAAASIGNNENQVSGVAYGTKIMPLRVSDLSGNASYSAIASAITYAADNGAKVVNVSYAAGASRTVQSAAKYMVQSGGLVVMAEGNNGSTSGSRNSSYIINVSATQNSDAVTTWSSYGNDVDVSAPGQAILTTTRGGGTDYYSGTSFSAPITAGVLALIWSANPALTADQAQNILFNSATDLGAPGWDQYYGWGRVDAGAAVAAALQTTPATISSGVPGRKK